VVFVIETEYIPYQVQAEAKENVDNVKTIIKQKLYLTVYKLSY